MVSILKYATIFRSSKWFLNGFLCYIYRHFINFFMKPFSAAAFFYAGRHVQFILYFFLKTRGVKSIINAVLGSFHRFATITCTFITDFFFIVHQKWLFKITFAFICLYNKFWFTYFYSVVLSSIIFKTHKHGGSFNL